MPNHQRITAAQPSYRSGAAARLTGIPVETLRVWERRYNVVGPRQSAKGQRLYSPTDVTRLSVIKRLVDSGHAIGSIAALDLEQLRTMLDKTALPSPRAGGLAGTTPLLRVAVVGAAIGLRLARRQLTALQVVASSADPSTAVEQLQNVAADALLIELPTVQRETPQAVRALARQLGARFIVIEYGFGPRHVEQELRAMGCHLMHAPLDISQLESLLGMPPSVEMPQTGAVAPRRFDSKTLAEIALASVALNCECPHHLAELVARLGNFETYSAECENRSPADAELHRYLAQVSGSARALLETALARVVEAEGISLTNSNT
jgi:DNA-binding transcriptional MerR regulator